MIKKWWGRFFSDKKTLSEGSTLERRREGYPTFWRKCRSQKVLKETLCYIIFSHKTLSARFWGFRVRKAALAGSFSCSILSGLFIRSHSSPGVQWLASPSEPSENLRITLRLTGTFLAYRLYEYRGRHWQSTLWNKSRTRGFYGASQSELRFRRSSTSTSVRLLFGWYSVLVHWRLLALLLVVVGTVEIFRAVWINTRDGGILLLQKREWADIDRMKVSALLERKTKTLAQRELTWNHDPCTDLCTGHGKPIQWYDRRQYFLSRLELDLLVWVELVDQSYQY